jgi:hypothetical protein
VGSWKGRDGIAVDTGEQKKGGNKFHGLFGRDPTALENGWSDLCKHFRSVMDNTTVVPMLLLRSEKGGSFHSGTRNAAGIEIDFERFLKNTNQDKLRHDLYDYEWNDEHKPLKQRGRYRPRGWVEVAYDEQLWQRLVQLRDQLRGAQQKYEELVKSGDFAKRLLSGGMNLLGHDQ